MTQSGLSKAGETIDPFVRRPTAPTIPAFSSKKAGAPSSISSASKSGSSSSSVTLTSEQDEPAKVETDKAMQSDIRQGKAEESTRAYPEALLELHTTFDIDIDIGKDLDEFLPERVRRSPSVTLSSRMRCSSRPAGNEALLRSAGGLGRYAGYRAATYGQGHQPGRLQEEAWPHLSWQT